MTSTDGGVAADGERHAGADRLRTLPGIQEIDQRRFPPFAGLRRTVGPARSSRRCRTSRDGLTEVRELQGVGKLAAVGGTQRIEEGVRRLMPGGAGYGAERETDC